MLRPWLAALALIACAVAWLTAYAWSVQFQPPAVLEGLARTAESVRLPAIAVRLHVRAAEMHRARVRALREIDAPEAERREARFALANGLRSAALIMQREEEQEVAVELLTEAMQAAPERADLRVLRTDLATRDGPAAERRVELLRLVYRHDQPLAHYLVAQSFLDEGADEAALGYLTRAAEGSDGWAEPHLALARLHLRGGRAEEAADHAREALAAGGDPRTQLAAGDLLRRAGGDAPERWRVIGEYALERYTAAALLAAAFVVLLFSPVLVALGARAVARVREKLQRDMPESAS